MVDQTGGSGTGLPPCYAISTGCASLRELNTGHDKERSTHAGLDDHAAPGHGTEYTAKILYGPGSESLNVPFSSSVRACSNDGSKHRGFVSTSAASELHDSGEHSGDVCT